jgi:7,8-dihydropterin-6-yl-methyl-4-(beta-D-ribofuranosyl)aminobenzene 5'-phosphate synthase
MTQAIADAREDAKRQLHRLRFRIVYNNVPYKSGLVTDWGFSCLIEGLEKTVLFDTGGDGETLLANMQLLKLDPKAVDVVVLSHIHADHVGGLLALLAHSPDVTVYTPASFPASFRHEVNRLGATLATISAPQWLFDSVYSTGEMGVAIKEQALIVDTPQGLVMVTGCAHPNIVPMAQQAQAYLDRNILLLIGGFHLGGSSKAEIGSIIKRLKSLGVRNVAPSHCTGDSAIRMLREEWKQNFVEGGLGAVIEVPKPDSSE